MPALATSIPVSWQTMRLELVVRLERALRHLRLVGGVGGHEFATARRAAAPRRGCGACTSRRPGSRRSRPASRSVSAIASISRRNSNSDIGPEDVDQRPGCDAQAGMSLNSSSTELTPMAFRASGVGLRIGVGACMGDSEAGVSVHTAGAYLSCEARNASYCSAVIRPSHLRGVGERHLQEPALIRMGELLTTSGAFDRTASLRSSNAFRSPGRSDVRDRLDRLDLAEASRTAAISEHRPLGSSTNTTSPRLSWA